MYFVHILYDDWVSLLKDTIKGRVTRGGAMFEGSVGSVEIHLAKPDVVTASILARSSDGDDSWLIRNIAGVPEIRVTDVRIPMGVATDTLASIEELRVMIMEASSALRDLRGYVVWYDYAPCSCSGDQRGSCTVCHGTGFIRADK